MSAIVEQMKIEIETLIKERDKFKAAYYSAERCASDLSKGCAKLQTERDSLRAARYAYASEFSLNEEGQPDIGSIHQNIRALKANHTEVMDAAKIALDALYTSSHYTSALPEYHLSDFEVNEAIAALRKAGVK